VREFRIALDMVADGRVQADALISHRYPLVDIADAFRAADDKRGSGAVKVLVQP
jgi:threonine dehydrogenase-like Zn-dependent dehydrogenase